jgi:hypothetical protein
VILHQNTLGPLGVKSIENYGNCIIVLRCFKPLIPKISSDLGHKPFWIAYDMFF